MLLVPTRKSENRPQRRFVDEPPANPEWDAIIRIADKHYPLFYRAFIDAFGKWREGVAADQMIQGLAAISPIFAARLANDIWQAGIQPTLLGQLRPLILDTVAEATEAALPIVAETIGAVAPDGSIGIAFNRSNPRVTEWARRFAANEIANIGETTKQAIRETIARGVDQGRTIPQMAKELREMIGLTPQQASTLARYRQRMLDAGVKRSLVTQKVESRYKRMLNQRARTIAANESHMAAVYGHRETMLAAREAGVLDESRYTRHWIVARDERTCPTCSAIPGLNPDGVGLDEPFQTPIGPLLVAHAHVKCRCTEAGRFAD